MAAAIFRAEPSDHFFAQKDLHVLIRSLSLFFKEQYIPVSGLNQPGQVQPHLIFDQILTT
jgi:hypothetical protein